MDGGPILLGGDIVTHVNGTKIDEPSKLATLLREFKVGTVAKLTLLREGASQTVELLLTERPMQPWDLPGRRTGSATPVKPSGATGPHRVRQTIVF